jgi:hypothetical protein
MPWYTVGTLRPKDATTRWTRPPRARSYATFPPDERPASDRIRRKDQASDEQPLQLRRIDVRIARSEALPEPTGDEAEPALSSRLAGRGELCDDLFAISPLVEHPEASTPRRSRWHRGSPRRPGTQKPESPDIQLDDWGRTGGARVGDVKPEAVEAGGAD